MINLKIAEKYIVKGRGTVLSIDTHHYNKDNFVVGGFVSYRGTLYVINAIERVALPVNPVRYSKKIALVVKECKITELDES